MIASPCLSHGAKMYGMGGVEGATGLQGVLLPSPPGLAGVMHTLRAMRSLVDAGRVMPIIRQQAVALTAYLPQKDYISEIRAIFDYVCDEIRYVRDVFGVETLHSPDVILRLKSGDCDDKSVLLASMLESIGHRCVFVSCGPAPDKMVHVYVRAWCRGKWIDCDATEPHPLGWRPKMPFEIVFPAM